MPLKLVSILLLFFFGSHSVSCQGFNAQQKAWLFKIVMKTPSLKRNWAQYFEYKDELPQVKLTRLVNGKLTDYVTPDWEKIDQNIMLEPDILNIDFEHISKTSPGLIADAAVKLTLWELYSRLKEGLVEEAPFSSNETAVFFKDQMIRAFPPEMQSGNQIKKKYLPILYDILNPSMPIYQKSASLAAVKKVSIQSKKKVLDRWHSLVKKYVNDQSTAYFNLLTCKEIYFNGQLLAAGEGSGSSGLLREFEKREGNRINTGTGKGIGLFTYDMSIKRDQLIPKFNTNTSSKALKNEPTLLHLSLWGIDSSKKPLIVIENKDNSYLLFADFLSNEISPDPNSASGISYLDRIREFEQKKINEPLKELNKENGLLTIYERENAIKEQIANKITQLELEIDSLKEVNASEVAINNRKSKIEINLANQTKKESKLNELQNKMTEEYRSIDLARKKMDGMKAALGKNIQTWTKKDSIYTFADGTIFNQYTQDLILYTDSSSDKIDINLLAASFSLGSEKKDEVQLYVNTTGGVDRIKYGIREVTEYKPDTLIVKSCYFEPDEYTLPLIFTSAEKTEITQFIKDAKASNKKLIFNLVAAGIDTILHPDIKMDKLNYQVKKHQAAYNLARRANIAIIKTSNTCIFNITGFTDAGDTKLSKLSSGKKEAFHLKKHIEQSYNPFLSAFRVAAIVNELGEILEQDFSEQIISIKPLNLTISIKDINGILNK